MLPVHTGESTRFKAYTARHIDELARRARLSTDDRRAVRAVAAVLPFRVNSYVIDELIDWSAAPDDPIFRLVFPHRDMLPSHDVAELTALIEHGAHRTEIHAAVQRIRQRLNPHPAGQMQLNVPVDEFGRIPGVQHKYVETVLFFPSAGQTCHAYCSYCFRWPQFVEDQELRFASSDINRLVRYLRRHPYVTNVLITGGDPMIMSSEVLARYVAPLLTLDQLDSIRIGTKSLAYWPQRWVTDTDADLALRLFEQVRRAGKSLALMAHYSHPRELEPDIAVKAIQRIRSAGATIRTQAPIIRSINDAAATWTSMWRIQERLGMVPYYMFIERDTGPRAYFEIPLVRAQTIFHDAYKQVSGLCRTVRGPSMSATHGKVVIDGVLEVAGERVFALRFMQARDPSLVNRPFFAQFDQHAVWFDELRAVPGLPWLPPSNHD